MPKITFRTHDGEENIVDAKIGQSVMEAAVGNGVPGIDADCGGACACATCHVYADPAHSGTLPAPADTESSMLEFADNVRPNSRLSCQIEVTEKLDGLVFETPPSQG